MNLIRIAVKSMMLLAIMFMVSFGGYASSKRGTIRSGERWLDTNGNLINAHGGGILFHKGKYYWFGEGRSEKSSGFKTSVGVKLYSSKDLYNWTDEGVALPCSDEVGSDIQKGCIIERPKVIYNKKTKKFVMWFHLELKGQGYEAARTGLAVSDNVEGPYTFIKSLRPNAGKYPINYEEQYKDYEFPTDLGRWSKERYQEVVKGMLVKRDLEGGQMARDMTLFVDDDGKAYHIHASEENETLHISELTDDYLDFTGVYTRVMPTGANEAPALFKKDGVYYMMASGCTGWAPNEARMFRTTNILGEWEALGNPCVGKDSDKTFFSQSTHILPVKGKKDTFIYMGDRWNPEDLIESRYIWLPIHFEDDKPVIRWVDEWKY